MHGTEVKPQNVDGYEWEC